MGTVHTPAPVQLFCGLLLSPTVPVEVVEATLVQTYGPIVLRSTPVPFTQTDYYTREMGPTLTRQFCAFAHLIPMEALAGMKHTTNHLEATWATPEGQRRVNLDPGYLDLAKVVLASTKDHSHRLYIGAGIYAEVTLRYRQRAFQPWAWTYPDYQTATALDFFHQLRALYHTRLRGASQSVDG